MRKCVLVGSAAVVVSLAAALEPGLARACSGPVPTFDEATAAASLIVAGEIVASPHDWAYELKVEEVFRGDVDATVLIGPPEPSATALICSHQAEIGDRLVVALRDRTDLGLFSSAVWVLLPDGTVATTAPEPPAATHEELFARLRLLPDTGMLEETNRNLPLALGAALALAAAGTLSLRRLAQRQHRHSVTPS